MIRTIKTEPPPPPSWPTPPLFSELRFWRGGGSDRVGRLRTPKSAVSRAETPRYPKISAKTPLLGGKARRRRKILGFWGPPKCDSLRGKRSKRGPKSGKTLIWATPPPCFRPIWARRGGGGGGSVLIVLIPLYFPWIPCLEVKWICPIWQKRNAESSSVSNCWIADQIVQSANYLHTATWLPKPQQIIPNRNKWLIQTATNHNIHDDDDDDHVIDCNADHKLTKTQQIHWFQPNFPRRNNSIDSKAQFPKTQQFHWFQSAISQDATIPLIPKRNFPRRNNSIDSKAQFPKTQQLIDFKMQSKRNNLIDSKTQQFEIAIETFRITKSC